MKINNFFSVDSNNTPTFEDIKEIYSDALSTNDKNLEFQKIVQMCVKLRAYIDVLPVETDEHVPDEQVNMFREMIQFAVQCLEPLGHGYETLIAECYHLIGKHMGNEGKFNKAIEFHGKFITS